MSRFYTAPDGTRYPLSEARYSMSFRCYRSDCRKAIPGDPEQCVMALGIRRNHRVLHVYIGSGLDAYVIFKGEDGEPPHAVHFTISVPGRRVVRMFDPLGKKAEKMLRTATIELRAPTRGRTLEYRSRSNAERLKRIKAGTHLVKPRNPYKEKNIRTYRPRPQISKGGNVSMVMETAAEH